MKKILLLIASAALLLAGCAKEQIGVDQIEGGLVNATFTASLESGVATKAAVDGDGAAASVNRCIMEIYYGDELFARQYAPVNEQKKATFTAQVVSNRTYTVAFWADKVDATTEAGLQVDKYYTTNATGGLQAITINGSYIGNDDARDAFFHVGNYTVAQAGSSFGTTGQPILLKRPFAQMNVITTDWDKVASIAALKPEKVNVTLKNALVNFNAVTGEASGSQNLNYETSVYVADAHSAEKTLSMDYLFAPKTDKAFIDIDWKALHGTDTPVAHAFAAVPFQRNYRTNILGNFLSGDAEWTVIINPEWDTPEYDVDLLAVKDIEALQAKLDAGAREVHLLNAPTEDSEILISKLYGAASTLVITVPDTDKKLTIKTKEAGEKNYPALKLAGNVEDLVINLPESTVTLDGAYENIEAWTAANTLVVAKGSTFETLNVKKGKVVLYDVNLATKTTFANNCGIELHLEDLAALKAYAAADAEIVRKKGVTAILDADIDLNNEAWTPISGYQFAFDGNGHTVSNLKLDTEAKNVGFFGTPTSAKISNLTIDGAEVSGINHVAVLAGDGLCAQIENCTVKNATVESKVKNNDDGDKAAAICGYLSAEPSASIKNCHVENVAVKAYRDLAAIAGYANGSAPVVSGNTAKNVRVICNTDNNCKNYTSLAQYDANQVVGEKVASAVVENNTCDNVTVEYSNSEGIFSLGGSKWAVTSKDGFVKIVEKLALDVWHSQFTLLADIDLQGVNWTPLNGGSSADYTTTLDGNGHTISNLTISGTDNVGLFSNFAGTIKNLTVSGANVSGAKRVGVLAGQGSCFFMENVKIVNSTVTSTAYRVGALVGHCYTEGSFKNCVVDNANLSGQKYIGGITGTAGSGEAAATKFDSVTVKNTTISCSDESQKVDGTYGAFVGSYWVEPVVSGENINEDNTIFFANSGFGQHE